ncbi:unnamed protein product [Mytilus coruscus]|uniref:Uncharacterized protein n=1 Tax=Mytilus coruscus TaxID=42192 RepID=A0A6J8DLW4_MYTCO|nr:unnamed protein product [Mytilus coruscus]
MNSKKTFIFKKFACDVSVLVNFITTLYYYSSSGIDEEYGEKETLLDVILSLVEDEEKQKEKQKEKKETEENRGKDIRKRAMENLTPKKGTYLLSYNMTYLCSV